MKYYCFLPVALLAGCATTPELPSQQPLAVSLVDEQLSVQGVLHTSEQAALNRELEALVLVYSAINEQPMRCNFAAGRLQLSEQGNGAYTVDYQCPQAGAIEAVGEPEALPQMCEQPTLEQPVVTQWRGRKLPLMGYQGGFSISSQPPMSPQLAQNWAEQTILINAFAEGYDCKSLVIDAVSPECAHYGFAVRCHNG